MELILAPSYPPRFHSVLELLEVHVFAAMAPLPEISLAAVIGTA